MPTKARIKAQAKPRRKRSWRDIPDTIILALARKDNTRAESLCPSPATVWGCTLGDSRCRAIIDAWAFCVPVRTEALDEREQNALVFHGL